VLKEEYQVEGRGSFYTKFVNEPRSTRHSEIIDRFSMKRSEHNHIVFEVVFEEETPRPNI
jgi:hypothetical protein